MISQKLFDALKEKKADAIISESQQTRKWYTGISTSDGWLIIESNKEATLFVDGRYIEYAKNNAKNVKVNLLKKDSLQKWLIDKKFKKIAIEEDYLTIEKRDFLKKILQETKSGIKYILDLPDEDATQEECDALAEFIEENYDVDVDVQDGGQPVYSFVIGVE